jgi:hypothetical protein
MVVSISWHKYPSLQKLVCALSQDIGCAPLESLTKSCMYSCMSLVIQILGCTYLGGAYPMFCACETNLFSSDIRILVSWEVKTKKTNHPRGMLHKSHIFPIGLVSYIYLANFHNIA